MNLEFIEYATKIKEGRRLVQHGKDKKNIQKYFTEESLNNYKQYCDGPLISKKILGIDCKEIDGGATSEGISKIKKKGQIALQDRLMREFEIIWNMTPKELEDSPQEKQRLLKIYRIVKKFLIS